MYSYNDFECLFVRYQSEGVPSGISLAAFFRILPSTNMFLTLLFIARCTVSPARIWF